MRWELRISGEEPCGAIVAVPLYRWLGPPSAVILSVCTATVMSVLLFGFKPSEAIKRFMEKRDEDRETNKQYKEDTKQQKEKTRKAKLKDKADEPEMIAPVVTRTCS